MLIRNEEMAMLATNMPCGCPERTVKPERQLMLHNFGRGFAKSNDAAGMRRAQDFAREEDPAAGLQSLSLKSFAKLIFRTCPALQPYSEVLDAIYKQFNDYKQARRLPPSPPPPPPPARGVIYSMSPQPHWQIARAGAHAIQNHKQERPPSLSPPPKPLPPVIFLSAKMHSPQRRRSRSIDAAATSETLPAPAQ